jgi:hypothetical protein
MSHETAQRCVGDALGHRLVSVAADAGAAADAEDLLAVVAGELDDLVPGQATHGRACDRSGEPVPRFDELILGPLVVLERHGQSVRCHARSMPPRPTLKYPIRQSSREQHLVPGPKSQPRERGAVHPAVAR